MTTAEELETLVEQIMNVLTSDGVYEVCQNGSGMFALRLLKVSDGIDLPQTDLPFFIGPGYRVSIGQDGGAVVGRLCGEDRTTQSSDIETTKM